MTLSTRILWIIAVCAATGIGWVAVINSGADYPWRLYAGHFPDLASDKYTALAAVDGSDPYATLDRLADRYGFADSGYPAPHPRTPAALLVQTPLILMPDRWLVLAGVPMMVGAIAILLWSTTRIARIDSRWGVLGMFAWVASPLFSWDILYPTAGFISWLVVLGWWLIRRRPTWAGVALGTAAAMKLWPALIVASLLIRRDTRRIGWTAVAAGGVSTAGGLALPGTSVTGTIDALQEAGAYFGQSEGNLSALGAFGWPVLLISAAVFFWGLSRDRVDWRMACAVGAGLLSSPLVWGNYFYAALPVAALGLKTLFESRQRESHESTT